MTSSLDASDVLAAITDYDYSFYWGSFTYGAAALDNLVVDGVAYSFEVVDRKTGSEGDWQTNTYLIFKVGDQYFRKNGYYASHDGEYWDGSFEEVNPVERTVIDWV